MVENYWAVIDTDRIGWERARFGGDLAAYCEAMRTTEGMAEWLSTDEYPIAPLVASLDDGDLSSTTARQPAPNVIAATLTHKPALDGTYKMPRRGVYVVDSNGLSIDTRGAVRRADMLLRATAPDEYHDWRLLVGAMGEDSCSPLTVAHRPEVLEGVKINGRPVVIGREIAPGLSGTQARGKVTRGRCDVATYVKPPTPNHLATMLGRLPLPAGSIGNVTPTGTRCVTRYRGMTLAGHGKWIASQRKRTATTRAQRAQRAALKAQEAAAMKAVHASQALDHARAVALSLWQAREQTKTTESKDANTVRGSTLSQAFTVNNHKVTITLPMLGNRYRLVIVHPDKTRTQTNSTSPDGIAAALANRLHLLV